jgi:hypothetical protein
MGAPSIANAQLLNLIAPISMNLRKQRDDMRFITSVTLVAARITQTGTGRRWGVLLRFSKSWLTPDGADPVLHGVC